MNLKFLTTSACALAVGLFLSIGQINESAAQEIQIDEKTAEIMKCMKELKSLYDVDKMSIETKRKKEECLVIMDQFKVILDPS